MTVGELLDRVSSRELTEWMAYEQVEGPLGSAREDVLTGIISAVIANTQRDAKKQPKPFSPADFMPVWDKPEKSWEDVMSQVVSVHGEFTDGGED